MEPPICKMPMMYEYKLPGLFTAALFYDDGLLEPTLLGCTLAGCFPRTGTFSFPNLSLSRSSSIRGEQHVCLATFQCFCTSRIRSSGPLVDCSAGLAADDAEEWPRVFDCRSHQLSAQEVVADEVSYAALTTSKGIDLLELRFSAGYVAGGAEEADKAAGNNSASHEG